MSKLFRQVLKTTPVVLGASLLAANSAVANPQTTGSSNEQQIIDQVQQYNNEAGNSMSQVTSVSQLRDVSPGDWAYEALRNLVERYGCIVGYPNQTYRGNTALSRYEFAAGLNACLQRMEALIASSEAVAREDLERMQLLMQEFEAELAAIGARVDGLDGRVAFLEDHQFSTTTKLNGEVIMALTQSWGEIADGSGDDLDTQVNFGYRARLNFDTSFTGEDRLRTRLQAGNVPDLFDYTDSLTSRLNFGSPDESNVFVEKLWYSTPVGDNFRVHVAAVGVSFDDIADPKNPFFAGSGTGSLSRFGDRNPAVYRTGDAAIGLNWTFAEQFSVDIAYLVGNGADPSPGNGVFDGSYMAAIQFNWDPNEDIGVALTYGYSYETPGEVNLTGGTGSVQATDPFDGAGANSNRVGLEATWRLAEKFNLAGWFGWVNSSAASGRFEDEDSANIWNFAINFAVLDLGKEGSQLGFIFGIPPGTDYRTPDDTSYFLEALYKYPITDNISVTPGAYVIFNPNQNDNNGTIVVGTIRTTFKF